LDGDEDEDDLCEDSMELFGHNNEALVQVSDGQEGCGEEGAQDDQSAKRSCPSTSTVWLDFQKLFKTINGKKVMYAAKCIHCSKQHSALSSGGTGHLTRHRDKCSSRREKPRMSQPQISFNTDDSMHNWKYYPMVSHNELVQLLSRLEVPKYG
jgi:hypothetical protein